MMMVDFEFLFYLCPRVLEMENEYVNKATQVIQEKYLY